MNIPLTVRDHISAAPHRSLFLAGALQGVLTLLWWVFDLAGRYADMLDIRAADHDMPIKLLSGGNQQKAILARWLAIDPTFLILDEPTRGIDVGAHAEIVRTINRLREEGLALLVISSELDEVVAYSNRIVVMRDRAMVAELTGEEVEPDAVVRAIAGTRSAEVRA